MLSDLIGPLNKTVAKEKIREFLDSEGPKIIVTPNPEIVVMCAKNPEFLKIIAGADLKLSDGIGLVFAARFFGIKTERITGTDFLGYIMRLAAEEGRRVGFLGGVDGAAFGAAQKFSQKYPGLKICFAEHGGKIEFSENRGARNWRMDPNLLDRIQKTGPEILIVGLGQEKQEFWIADNISSLPSVKIAMGVGGALDLWSGKIKRAPKWMRKLGLEWLWRLMLEPRRIGRIANAVIIFPAIIFLNRLRR